jgi:CheY-like chemotaxis protein
VKPCRATVLEATSGAEGVHLVRTAQPQAVILDYELPDETGLQVLRALRETPDTAQVPVIIHTAKVLSETEQVRLRAAGVRSILSKARLSDADGVAQFRHVLHELGIHA